MNAFSRLASGRLVASLLATLATSSGALIAQNAISTERVQELVQAAGKNYGVKGLAVAVVQDGESIESAYGEAVAGTAMTNATLCNIASCSKAFTAAAVAMLVEQKQLAWDDLVIEHMPEFRLSDSWITAHMTIRDLLCHRCGLVTFAGDLLWYGSDYSDEEVIRRMAKLPIEQRFREQFGYQNLMYLVAGKIVERKTGKSWSAFVQENLLTPLAMSNSRPDFATLPEGANVATPHIDGKAVKPHVFVACKPAASIYSSVHELTNWINMLLAGGKWQGKQMLSQASMVEMWQPHTSTARAGSGIATDDFASYGLGWFLTLERGNKVVEHDGGMPGFLSKVSLMPAEKFGFAILNNSNDGIVNEAMKRALYAERAGKDGMAILDRIAQIKQRIDRRDANQVAQREANQRKDTKPSHELADYAGSYEDEIYGPAAVKMTEAGELHLTLIPSKRRIFGTMKHWHDDTWRVDFPDTFLPFALVTFAHDSTGKIASFGIDCPIADFDFGALKFARQK